MSSHDKLLKRLLSKPADFKWTELLTLLASFDFESLNGSGSRRKFRHKDTNILIIAHEPHPKKIMKLYAIEQIIDKLREGGFIK